MERGEGVVSRANQAKAVKKEGKGGASLGGEPVADQSLHQHTWQLLHH